MFSILVTAFRNHNQNLYSGISVYCTDHDECEFYSKISKKF